MGVNKVYASAREAVADIKDGSAVMLSGFGDAGKALELIDALAEQGAKNLTLVTNGIGGGERNIGALFARQQVSRLICTFPRAKKGWTFDKEYLAGNVKVEVTPQGTLAERIRAAGAGIEAFYTPVGVGTEMAEGKESRTINGREHLLEYALHADVALIRAFKADTLGNLVFRKTGRNFGPIMAMAAKCAIVQVDEIVEPGELDPEEVVTPCIFVQRIVQIKTYSGVNAGLFRETGAPSHYECAVELK